MLHETSKIRGQSVETGCPFFVAEQTQYLASLTPRELEVLSLAALGLTSKGIAKRLSIAEVTAKKHSQAACRTLGAANITNAVAIALSRRLIQIDSARP